MKPETKQLWLDALRNWHFDNTDPYPHDGGMSPMMWLNANSTK